MNLLSDMSWLHRSLADAIKRAKSYDAVCFYPGGISSRKRLFTSDELIDIYIKGNPGLLDTLYKDGFRETVFSQRGIDPLKFVLEAVNSWGIHTEAKKAFLKLLVTYLDIHHAVSDIGAFALMNAKGDDPDENKLDKTDDIDGLRDVLATFSDGSAKSVSKYGLSIREVIYDLEAITGHPHLRLYYGFFEAIEELRYAKQRLKASTLKRGFESRAEETVVLLQKIHDGPEKIWKLARLIDFFQCESSRRKSNG